MADIFISYSQADRPWVEKLARLIEREGFSVWWDVKVLPGDEFGNLVLSEINTAKCVLVVWSQHSVNSDWVYGEADEARRSKKLVPVLKDAVPLPTAFRKIHAADLSGWDLQPQSPELAILLDAIRGRVRATMENSGATREASLDPRLQAQQQGNPPGANARQQYAQSPYTAPRPGSLQATIATALDQLGGLNKTTLRIIAVLAIVLTAIKQITYFESPIIDFWNMYWTLSEWAVMALFAVLAFSQAEKMPWVVRAFLGVVALFSAVQIAWILSFDHPPPAVLPYFATYIGNFAMFAGLALSHPSFAAKLRPFTLAAIACWALLDISATSLTGNANGIVWLSAFLMRHALEVLIVCMAPAQYRGQRWGLIGQPEA